MQHVPDMKTRVTSLVVVESRLGQESKFKSIFMQTWTWTEKTWSWTQSWE